MERKLSKNAKKVWRTRCAMVCLLFAFISGGIYIFSPLIAFIVAGVDLLTFLIIYLIAVPLSCYNTCCKERRYHHNQRYIDEKKNEHNGKENSVC